MRWCSGYFMLVSTRVDGLDSRLLHIGIDAQGSEESTSVFDTSGILRRTE
jgi:hypothetical protein